MGARFARSGRLGGSALTAPVLVIGGAHIDRRGRIGGQTRLGASNPGTWFEEPGGGAFNAACNLARLGHPVRLIAPRGGDANGQRVAAAAEQAGIEDCPVVFLDRATPSYTAILENDGNLIVALADMALYDLFTPRRLRSRSLRDSLAATEHVLCDANLPGDTISALATSAARLGKPIAVIAISPAKAIRLKSCLPLLDHVFMNAAEAEVLAGARAVDPADWPELLRRAGLRAGTVTMGAGATVAFDENDIALVAPPRLAAISDITGAGDAFAAGFLSARISGETIGEALRQGTACAAITLRSRHATADDLTRELLKSGLALVPAAAILPRIPLNSGHE